MSLGKVPIYPCLLDSAVFGVATFDSKEPKAPIRLQIAYIRGCYSLKSGRAPCVKTVRCYVVDSVVTAVGRGSAVVRTTVAPTDSSAEAEPPYRPRMLGQHALPSSLI